MIGRYRLYLGLEPMPVYCQVVEDRFDLHDTPLLQMKLNPQRLCCDRPALKGAAGGPVVCGVVSSLYRNASIGHARNPWVSPKW